MFFYMYFCKKYVQIKVPSQTPRLPDLYYSSYHLIQTIAQCSATLNNFQEYGPGQYEMSISFLRVDNNIVVI